MEDEDPDQTAKWISDKWNGAPNGFRDDTRTETRPDEIRATQDMLQIHLNYNHRSFRRITEMARQGVFQKKFINCKQPLCAACLYSKAIKQRRPNQACNKDESRKATRPGEIVFVDQIVSPTAGFAAQISGFITKKRYRYATIYVDQYSNRAFVHLQKTSSTEEKIQGKKAFEKEARQMGITIDHYHADNDIFKAKAWVQDCTDNQQGLTFCGVNAHHHNGVTEINIRWIQEITRTSMTHAIHKWPKAIKRQLWPYALRLSNDALNNTPHLQHKQRSTPKQLYTGAKIHQNPKTFAHFGCPAYVLHDELQQNKPFHKWRARARVGVYLGKSPHHSRHVSLVMDLTTGHVFPQFHCVLDKDFSTVEEIIETCTW